MKRTPMAEKAKRPVVPSGHRRGFSRPYPAAECRQT
jgi:hypothetical protein